MAEVTKEDINRIYDKIEPIAISVTEIKTLLCQHLKAHDRISKPVVTVLTRLIEVAIVAIITWFLVNGGVAKTQAGDRKAIESNQQVSNERNLEILLKKAD